MIYYIEAIFLGCVMGNVNCIAPLIIVGAIIWNAFINEKNKSKTCKLLICVLVGFICSVIANQLFGQYDFFASILIFGAAISVAVLIRMK